MVSGFTKKQINKYLDKEVEIEIIDGTILNGTLHKSGDRLFKKEGLIIPKNYYFVSNRLEINDRCIFMLKHIRNVKRKDSDQ